MRAGAEESSPAPRRALIAQASIASRASGVREQLSNDLRTPEALDAIDAWAMSALRGAGDDSSAPALMRAGAQALLGVRL